MAFTVLNEDRLLLLTDLQREQYEKEFDIYKKRVDFVEQLEKYENINMKPFEPNKPIIFVRRPIEVQGYKQPKCDAKIHKIDIVEITKEKLRNFHLYENIGVPSMEYKQYVQKELSKPDLAFVSNRSMIPNFNFQIDTFSITPPEIPLDIPRILIEEKKLGQSKITCDVPDIPITSLVIDTTFNIESILKGRDSNLPYVKVEQLEMRDMNIQITSMLDLPVLKTKNEPTSKQITFPNIKNIKLPSLDFPRVEECGKILSSDVIAQEALMNMKIPVVNDINTNVLAFKLQSVKKIAFNKISIKPINIKTVKTDKTISIPINIIPNMPKVGAHVTSIQPALDEFVMQWMKTLKTIQDKGKMEK